MVQYPYKQISILIYLKILTSLTNSRLQKTQQIPVRQDRERNPRRRQQREVFPRSSHPQENRDITSVKFRKSTELSNDYSINS